MIFKIIVICVFSTVTALLVNDGIYSKLIALSAGVISFMIVVPYIKNFIGYIESLDNIISGIDNYIKTTLKIIGVSFLCEFSSQLCSDAGERYLASKINLAGKIMIICIAVPEFITLINLVVELIYEI
ncbi:MAG: hypothetical protein II998_04935 [Clostridia bacterium]|nr:hypothetical protein [Clostridia bacterium]